VSLTAKQRAEWILTEIDQAGQVAVKGLAAAQEVSEATIRRDLRILADSGQIELVYGGATLPRVSDFSFRSKATRNIEAKRIIGRLAAGLVGDNEQIYLDSGTSCFEMCRHLKRRRGLCVIINSARLAVELSSHSDISTVMLGGHYRPERMDTVGPLATSTIDQLRGYRAFIGADGLHLEFGVTASDIESAYLHNQVIRNAREMVLLVDHTKFLIPSLYKIAEMEAISRVVTDRPPPPGWSESFNAQGIELIYPDSPQTETPEKSPAQPGIEIN
jgi:DeoR/GlpR family transcriptional regulator of sugar metabolism